MQTLIEQAIKLFNQTKYYEAHEVLEEYWNQLEEGDYRQQIQGIIQCTAALYLLQQNRVIGAKKVWARAQRNFENNIGLDNIDLNKLIRKTSELLD